MFPEFYVCVCWCESLFKIMVLYLYIWYSLKQAKPSKYLLRFGMVLFGIFKFQTNIRWCSIFGNSWAHGENETLIQGSKFNASAISGAGQEPIKSCLLAKTSPNEKSSGTHTPSLLAFNVVLVCVPKAPFKVILPKKYLSKFQDKIYWCILYSVSIAEK